MDIETILEKQRGYFSGGETLTPAFRRDSLLRLRNAIIQHEQEIFEALRADLNKSAQEAYITEIGMVLEQIHFAERRLTGWAKPKAAASSLAQFPAKSFVVPEPYGVVLIMAPWNYPFQLTLAPLVGAIAAGNCVVVKPSAYVPNTSRLLARLLGETFPPEYIAVVEGGRAENTRLLAQKFDYIFFTGSVPVGKTVMAEAAKNLTPVTLELGGKSPVIVDASADIPLAAKRIAWGKLLNAGQTCVAPDYLLIDRRVEDAFIAAYRRAVDAMIPGGDYKDFPTIVNDKHFARIMALIEPEKLVFGGAGDEGRRFIAPTLMRNVGWNDPIMQEEIFGPVLPVIGFDRLDEAIAAVRARPKPLALYLFTRDRQTEKKVLGSLSFGGGCVNDTIMHLASNRLGFGGVGESGMGRYHGKYSFDTFTHYKSIVKRHTFADPGFRYPPYSDKRLALIRRLMK